MVNPFFRQQTINTLTNDARNEILICWAFGFCFVRLKFKLLVNKYYNNNYNFRSAEGSEGFTRNLMGCRGLGRKTQGQKSNTAYILSYPPIPNTHMYTHMGSCMFIRVHAHTGTTHTHFPGCVSGEAGLPAWPVPAPVGWACAHVPAGETLQPAVMGRANRHGLWTGGQHCRCSAKGWGKSEGQTQLLDGCVDLGTITAHIPIGQTKSPWDVIPVTCTMHFILMQFPLPITRLKMISIKLHLSGKPHLIF